jgi:hypothetical protein
MANVTRSPRLAATGVATLSGLILNFRETETYLVSLILKVKNVEENCH